ncbi:MAG: DUF362 domain-containing protein [Actinomycetota bacterium]|nr:DUF362 domain-containing protein [Actinomycetota bacterium]
MNHKSGRVSIVKCRDYDKKNLKEAIKRCVGLIGGFEKFLDPQSKILLKPNLLLSAPPGRAITTHPLFIEAVIENIVDVTGKSENILIADSFGPATPYNKKGMEKIYGTTGMTDIAERTGCRLNYSAEYECLSNKNGRILKRTEVIKPVIEADVIINLPKFKTHNLTVISGAIKNMFGIIPGFNKVGYHLRFDDLEKFAGMLLDVISFIKPALNIMDGVWGIEGEGPGRRGTPRNVGLILASSDAISMDIIMSRIMNVPEALNPFMEVLKKWNAGSYMAEYIEVAGEKLSDTIIHDFKIPEGAGQKRLITNNFINTYILPFVRNSLNPYLYIDYDKCSFCMTCRSICPHKSITSDNKRIKFNRRTCIRCFCCSEMCPEGAIGIKYPFLGNLIFNWLEMAGKLTRKRKKPDSL